MLRYRSILSGTFLFAALGAGCADAEAPEDVEQTSAAVVAPNGVSLNGVSLNGVSLNGVSLNGVSLNGVSLNGVSLNGVSLNGVSLNGSALGGVRASDGVPVSGSTLVGATFQGKLSNGQVIALRCDAVTSGSGANADLALYTIAALGDSGWQPLCGFASGVAIAAIPLSGTWDYTQGTVGGGSRHNDSTSFTFACLGTALAKCVEIGYRPWSSVGSVSLADYHQACTRMIRADYCGDGTPHTVNGTPINVYDGLGVQLDTEAWGVEAEWRSDGARCVTANRRGALTSPAACVVERVAPDCGATSHLNTGSLLMNEYRRKPVVAPSLGAAQGFAVLAASTVTNTGVTTTVTGDVGLSPGTAIVGIPTAQVMNGLLHAADPAAAQAQADTAAAYDSLAGAPCGTDLTGKDLGGKTLLPGVYCFSSSVGLTGTLTLDGRGDPNAVFIFQIGSTLTTASASAVTLINDARDCGVYWQVGSSATLGTGTALKGNILALASITLTTGASVSGRALAQNAAVTMDRNSVVAAASCK